MECKWFLDVAEFYGYEYVGEHSATSLWEKGYRPFHKDSAHEIFKIRDGENIRFQDDVELHRFLNAAGVPYSAIYVNKTELMNNPRPLECLLVLSAYMRYASGKTE